MAMTLASALAIFDRSIARETGDDPLDESDDDAMRIQHPLFYPGMYSPSGFDLMKILYYVAIRPRPTIDLGPVDASCPIVLCDLYLPDYPAVYVSDSFLSLTGYNRDEVLGRNCRFLQQSPPTPTPPLRWLLQKSCGNGTEALDSAGWSRLSDDTSPYIDFSVRQEMRLSVAQNTEAQVQVVNFRKDGTAFVNFLSLVPIYWDSNDDYDDGGSSNDTINQIYADDNIRKDKSNSALPLENSGAHIPRRHRYSVGFLCDLSTVG